ncbi:uncharacterized protein CDV56_108845 [Aspergillus thermomutatus]|uniref:Uncharacterized protein n=1 Tax=Aspergillus thermomutatus TaxID=41047 RepID=A0A397HX25_ASPTH|nr:uncharacterized protein CDV56_108845 [Aspergillus thermomutatus]RHZ67347.1 hypothetical protein CDV56_108845 [Aspergillus thermomutatus]
MKWSTLLPLAISTLSLFPSTGAWEITWTDSDNKEQSQSGHGPSDCIVIDNPKGHLFKIDSQGEKGINMLLFTNNECSGKQAGMATDVFSKESSQDLLGFKVVSLSSTTTSATATTGKSVSRVATTFPTSPSQTASTSGSDDGESMTIQTTAATSPAATMTSGTSSGASSTTSSAASANTSNAAVQLAVSNGDIMRGLVGTIFGLGVVQWII